MPPAGSCTASPGSATDRGWRTAGDGHVPSGGTETGSHVAGAGPPSPSVGTDQRLHAADGRGALSAGAERGLQTAHSDAAANCGVGQELPVASGGIAPGRGAEGELPAADAAPPVLETGDGSSITPSVVERTDWTTEADEGRSIAPSIRASRGKTVEAKKLLDAAGRGDLAQVAALLEVAGAGVNGLRVRGCTALHEAAKGGHLPVVTDLLRRAAEVNAVNRNSCTALHFAVLCKDKVRALDVVEHLLDTSARVNATAERMDTPLHFAAYCPPSPGCEGVLRCLLARGAKVDARNRKSDTALMNASVHDNAGAARVLLEFGAHAAQHNSLGKTARDLANERECSEVLQVLDQHVDPISQLRDISLQMRTTLSMMQSLGTLKSEASQQSAMAEAYEAVAQSLVLGLDIESRATLADTTLQAYRDLHRQEDPGRLLQAVVTMRLLARSSGGLALLLRAGFTEALPVIENQASKNCFAQQELKELKTAMSCLQAELLEIDRFTPTSLDAPPGNTSGSNRHWSSISAASSSTTWTVPSVTGRRVPLPPSRGAGGGGDEAENDGEASPAKSDSGLRLQRAGLRLAPRGQRARSRSPMCGGAGKGGMTFCPDETLVVAEEPSQEHLLECPPKDSAPPAAGLPREALRLVPERSAPSSPRGSEALTQKTPLVPAIFAGAAPGRDGGLRASSADAEDEVATARSKSSRCCMRSGLSTCVAH